MMKWEAEQKGYTCNDCYLSMQNCHNKSICCEDETGLCDFFEELSDLKENKMNNDSISRQAAIGALWKALYEYEDKTEKQFIDSEELDVADWIQHRNFVQNMSDIDRQTILGLPSAQPGRKRGEWIRNDNGTYSCSVCQSWIPEQQHCYARYCLYCGADMRGEEYD